jgi:hypothetical protein
VYCLEHCQPAKDTAQGFRKALEGKRAAAVREALQVLRDRFVGDDKTEGHLKGGPVAVAKFELGESDADIEARLLRQRESSFLIEALLRDVLGAS